MSNMCVSVTYRAAVAVLAVLAGLAFGGQAHAQFEVESPQIHKGDAEIEVYGAYYTGLPNLPTSALRQSHDFEIVYGITEWWGMEIEAEFLQKRNGDGSFQSLKLSEIEIQNIFELLPLHGDGIGAAFFLAYGESVVNGKDESEVMFGPILKAARGPLSATVNLLPLYEFDIQEVENEGGVIMIEKEPNHWNFDYAWKVKHETSGHVAFGVEGYGSFKDIAGDLPGNQPERHRMGPVIYLSLGEEEEHGHEEDGDHEEGPELELTMGVLFGLNGDTSDVAFKYNAEIEF